MAVAPRLETAAPTTATAPAAAFDPTAEPQQWWNAVQLGVAALLTAAARAGEARPLAS